LHIVDPFAPKPLFVQPYINTQSFHVNLILISKIVDHIFGLTGLPVEPVGRVVPLKSGKCLILFFSGKRANGPTGSTQIMSAF
jgi:hypothetical protein